MHELSIATAILDRLELERLKLPQEHIAKVAVRVGEVSGVDPDALYFAFEVIVRDSKWEPLAIELLPVPRVQRCPRCALEFSAGPFDTACPACQELRTETIRGTELEIAYIEVDDEADRRRNQSSEREPAYRG